MNLYEEMDDVRRLQGRWLDRLGFGPVETPSRVVLSAQAFTLRAYGNGSAGPPLLIVPAPIKRAYLWDLLPRVSVVRQCLAHDIPVYLIQWEQPPADRHELGLAAYADRFIAICLDAVEAELGRRAFLAGHSLGGILAAIFATLHPERMRGFVLLAAPLHFGPDAGALGSAAEGLPPARFMTDLIGDVPGSLLNFLGVMASPGSFVLAPLADWFGSLLDFQAMYTHLQVIRWTHDELRLPRRLFEEVVELLLRKNRFMAGKLSIEGRPALPAAVKAPLLTVVEAGSHVVPPAAVLPFHDQAGSTEKLLLWYEGDLGVALQHVGVLVGRNAHRHIWPQIIRWLYSQ